MKFLLMIVALGFSMPVLSAATYKCSKNGVTSYQASPCDENDESKKLDINSKNKTNKTKSIEDEIGNKTQQIEENAAANIELINSKYAKELDQAKGNGGLIKEIETKKNKEILATYQEKKRLLEQEVERLSKIYDRENQAAQDNRKALQDLEK